MCDSYIGLDQEYTVDLAQVNAVIRSRAYQTSGEDESMFDPEAADP